MKKLISLASVFLFLTAFPDSGQSDQVSDLFDGIKDEMRQYRQVLKENVVDKYLPESEKKIFGSIQWQAPPGLTGEIVGPHAVKKGNTRIINFGPGFYRMLELSIVAIQIPKHFNRPGFASEYMDYVKREQAKAKSSALTPYIQTPEIYGKLAKQDAEFIYLNPECLSERKGLLLSAYAFILFHELGHHVLGHVDQAPKNLEESRANERAADEYALRILLKAGFLPIGGPMSIAVLAALRQGDVIYVNEETHPAEIQRVEYMMDFCLQNLDLFKERAESQGQDFEEIKAQMKKAFEEIKNSYRVIDP